MSAELLYLVRRRIREHGPLRFDDFMSLALYSDPHGYYRSHVPGADSDYHTSATLTPWFGRLAGRRLRQMWASLGSPDEFTVAEVGGGSGALGAAVLQHADGTFRRALHWAFVEPMPAIAELQASRLGHLGRSVRWVEELVELAPLTGCILANEVLDNFPFRIFEKGELGPVEVRVDAARHALQEALVPAGPQADPEILAALEHLEVGDRYEVRSGLGDWVSAVASALRAGYLLVIDYGDVEPQLWTRRPGGSMVTYRQGQLGTDPFEELGSADITAHVDFTDLARRLAAAGLHVQDPVPQRDWLRALGLDEVIDRLRETEAAAQQAGRSADSMAALAERSRVQALASGVLGGYLVLEAATPPEE